MQRRLTEEEKAEIRARTIRFNKLMDRLADPSLLSLFRVRRDPDR